MATRDLAGNYVMPYVLLAHGARCPSMAPPLNLRFNAHVKRSTSERPKDASEPGSKSTKKPVSVATDKSVIAEHA